MIPLSARWVRRAVGLAWIVLAGALQAAPITDIFFFGDSLTDAGNAAILNSGPGAPPRSPVPYPDAGYTPVYVPPWTRPYETSGRFTDGFTWATAFAAAFGFPGAAAPSGAGGNNYAVGGASVVPLSSPPVPPPSAVEQLAAFRMTHGGVSGGTFDPTALYFIGAGGNDLRAILTGAVAPDVGAGGIVLGLQSMVTDLLSWGAQRVVLWNMPDLTLSPQFLAAVGAGLILPDQAAAFRALINQINFLLGGLDQLPGVDVFDLAGLLRAIANDPTAFGLLNANLPCGFAGIYLPSGGACAQSFLFWDGVHPASGGHAVLARSMIAFVPEPATLVLVVLGLAGLVVRRRNGT